MRVLTQDSMTLNQNSSLAGATSGYTVLGKPPARLILWSQTMAAKKTTEERFWEKVAVRGADECWPWKGSHDMEGYGRMWADRKTHKAHRLAYELCVGPIPDDMCVCHTCDNPGCCNWHHLWIGTNADNMQDKTVKGRAASGVSHGRHTKPERTARGDRHGARLHPESLTRGTKCHSAVLTPDKVRAIRESFASGIANQRELGMLYGINQSSISKVIRGKSWKVVR